MNLDGYPVEKDDRLYDIDLRSVVKVHIVNDDAIITQATVNRRRLTRTYNSIGALAGGSVKILYWQNPLILVPPKHGVNWMAQVAAVKQFLRALETFAQQEANPTSVDEYIARPEVSSAYVSFSKGMLDEDQLIYLLNKFEELEPEDIQDGS